MTSNTLQTTVVGSLNSIANSTFLLQFFSSPTSDGSGFGEGEDFLGQASVATNISGNATFTADFPQSLIAGQFVSATATLLAGSTPMSTSEFSNAASVNGNLPTLSGTSTNVGEGDHGATEATFELDLTNPINKPVTVDYTTADGTATGAR